MIRLTRDVMINYLFSCDKFNFLEKIFILATLNNTKHYGTEEKS